MEYIKDYAFQIRYLPEKGNVMADALSRKFVSFAAITYEWMLME